MTFWRTLNRFFIAMETRVHTAMINRIVNKILKLLLKFFFTYHPIHKVLISYRMPVCFKCFS